MKLTYKKITTEDQYNQYLDEFEKLMDIDPDEGTEESDKFDLLLLLIEEYEAKNYKLDLPEPIDAIKFRMDQMGLKNKDLEEILGSKSKVSEVLNGKIGLSKAMIKKLNEKLGIPLNVLFETESELVQLKSAIKKNEDYEKAIEELVLSIEHNFKENLPFEFNPVSSAFTKLKDGIKFVYDCARPTHCDRVSEKKEVVYG